MGVKRQLIKMPKTIVERVKLRKPAISDDLIQEAITTSSDRLFLRINETEVPAQLESVVVEVASAILNRFTYEGVQSESEDGFSASFIDRLLDTEYQNDISLYLQNRAESTTGKVRFI